MTGERRRPPEEGKFDGSGGRGCVELFGEVEREAG